MVQNVPGSTRMAEVTSSSLVGSTLSSYPPPCGPVLRLLHERQRAGGGLLRKSHEGTSSEKRCSVTPPSPLALPVDPHSPIERQSRESAVSSPFSRRSRTGGGVPSPCAPPLRTGLGPVSESSRFSSATGGSLPASPSGAQAGSAILRKRSYAYSVGAAWRVPVQANSEIAGYGGVLRKSPKRRDASCSKSSPGCRRAGGWLIPATSRRWPSTKESRRQFRACQSSIGRSPTHPCLPPSRGSRLSSATI